MVEQNMGTQIPRKKNNGPIKPKKGTHVELSLKFPTCFKGTRHSFGNLGFDDKHSRSTEHWNSSSGNEQLKSLRGG